MDEVPSAGGGLVGESSGPSEEEFNHFLSSIGWGSSYRCGIAVPKSPEAFPQLAPDIPAALEPKPDLAKVLPRQARGDLIRIATAIVLVLCVLFRDSLEEAVAGRWAQFTGQAQAEARASALLTQARFFSLRPGATAEEVRDRVGLPDSRVNAGVLGGQQEWYYTTAPDGPKGPQRFYVVVMSEGRVVRVLDLTELRSRPAPGIQPARPRYCGDLNVLVPGGEETLLHADAGTATVLFHPAAGQAVPSDFPVRTLRANRLTAAKTGEAIAVRPVALYWRGILHALPSAPKGDDSGILVDDLKWLFKNLGCDETGSSVSTKTAVPFHSP